MIPTLYDIWASGMVLVHNFMYSDPNSAGFLDPDPDTVASKNFEIWQCIR